MLKFMVGNRVLYTGAIMAIGIATLLSFATPMIIRTTIDSIIGSKPMEAPTFIKTFVKFFGGTNVIRHNLWIAAIFMITLSIIRGFFDYIKGRWSARASESIAQNLRNKLYNHLQKVPVKYHSKTKTGDLIQRCTSDVETIRRFLSVQVVEIGRATMMITLIIPIMLTMNAKMTLISVSLVPLILIFAFVFFVKIRSYFKTADEAEGSMTAVLQENLTGIRVVRAFARQTFEKRKFDEKNNDYRGYSYSLIKLLAIYWGVSDFLIYSQTGLVLISSTIMTINGDITLGTMVAFFTLMEYILWPIRQTGRILADLGKAFVSVERINEVLNYPEEDNLGVSLKEDISGNIEFNKLNFSYNSDTPILKNISFKVENGQTVVLFGPTGSGKSTLVNLLPRLWNYDDGSIKIDGKELNQFNRKYIRSQIGIVLQEPFLYSKTLQENISLGKTENVSQEELLEVSQIAAIHNEIQSFEKGYDTPVGEKGVTLSGGQRQRIAIARALLQNPPILIFDDSLSALDTDTETQLQNALIERKGQSTTIVISHRLSTAVSADNIIVLDKGEIIQTGNHFDLIKEEGLYRRIWNMQTGE